MVASLSAFYPEMDERDPEENIDLTVTRMLSKMRTIAAFIYRQTVERLVRPVSDKVYIWLKALYGKIEKGLMKIH